MEAAQVRLKAGGEDRFLDSFVKLEKVWMPGAHADPNDFRPAFGRESAKAKEREKERFPGNGVQFFGNNFLGIGADVAKKREGEMHLARFEPANATKVSIE